MKKTALIVIFTLVLVLTGSAFAKSVLAQDFTAAKAYSDYQYQTSNYLRANDEYAEAKVFYKKNPTLQLQEEARLKTLAMLKARDQLMVVYLTAIRMQLVETTGFNADEKGAMFGKIDPEVAWYQAHIANYTDGDDLNTLFNKSDESKDRYKAVTTPILYNSLFDITLSEEVGMRNDHQAIYADLKNFINDKVSQGVIKIDPFNRWLSDTDTVLSILKQNEVSAKNIIPKFYSPGYNLSNTYATATIILKSAVGPLSQLNNYLTEMLSLLEEQPL